MWSEANCQCQCSPSEGRAKYRCALDSLRQWDEALCSCVCRSQPSCPPGRTRDLETCLCGEAVAQCSVSPLYSLTTTSHTARVATYIGLLAIAMVTLTILITLYLMATKKRPYRDLR